MPDRTHRASGAPPALAELVDHRDGFREPLATIAGLDVVSGEDAILHAAAVLLDADTLEVLARHVVHLPASTLRNADPHPARELPALLAALSGLPRPPDLAFVAAHGRAHPQGFGLAAHFGVAGGLPAIGVAGTILYGSGPEPHQTRGAYTALRDAARRQIGWLLRSLPGSAPLVVSPGHRVALASAADLVMRFTRAHRLPEPIRLARELVEARTSRA